MNKKFKYKLATPVLMWAIVIIGGMILWQIAPVGRVFSVGMFGGVFLLLGVITWLYVMFSATRVHRQAPASVDSINQLITTGIYSSVRHPIYSADIALALSAFLFFPSYKVLTVMVWLALVLLLWARFEERMLKEKFPQAYNEYKKQVPMLIPRLSRKK
jgi:protein-S-isoprenylcysteine O-methyltransferase Ste14